MEKRGADAIVIYCNSMAGAINISEVRKRVSIPVITPHDVYREVAKKFDKIGVMAANCTSTSNIEKAIVNSNPNATVIGYANLDIVNDIERGGKPKQIVEKHGVDKFANIIDKNNIKAIILGCTHFPYFYKEIQKRTSAKVIEPSEEILKILSKNLHLERNI
ncbi:MAG TPA: aspartate/glutamate racemase family protein [archaeon]|nr:aspartate/glutamate racemase family protein [archaeon]